MKKSYLIALGLLFVFSFTGLSCNLFSKKTTDTTTTDNSATTTTSDTILSTTNLTNVDPLSLDDLITTNYNLAKSKAQDWQADSVLVNITIKLPRNLAYKQAAETYVFGSNSNPTNWFSFSISEQSSKYIRAVIPKEDYLGSDIKPINATYWKMNYLKAFQLAETNGGSTFRGANTNTDIVTTLANDEPKGWLWWKIEYKSTDTGKFLIIKVNPNDSTVIDENGNPLSTATATQ